MICSLAFHNGDKPAAKRLLRLIIDLCGQQPYTLILAAERGVEDPEIKDLAQRAFKTANMMVLDQARNEWPDAPNSYFYQIAKAMSENTKEEWLFLEPDVTILKKDAFYLVRQDYTACGKEFYGPISPTYRPAPEGGIKRTGDHLLGVAIYPWDYFLRSKLLKWMPGNNAATRQDGGAPDAFDVFLEGETTPNAHESELMQHAWRSKNFRRVNGQIHFDVTHDLGQIKVISDKAVMFHGAKDDSLERIVRQRELGAKYEPAAEQIIPDDGPMADTLKDMADAADSCWPITREMAQSTDTKLNEVAAILTTLSRKTLNSATRLNLAMEGRRILTECGIPCLENEEVKRIEKEIKRKKYATQPKIAFDPIASKKTDTPDWMLRPDIAKRHQELTTIIQTKKGVDAVRSMFFAKARELKMKGVQKMKMTEKVRFLLAAEFGFPIPGVKELASAA